MNKERLAAFSDGVFAIIITIMVLELKPPHSDNFVALIKIWPTFTAYVLSFVYVGIYWNNHHHLFYTFKYVSAEILWANLHLLFWLSLIPFATAWMGENHYARAPVALYGASLLASAIAYYILQIAIVRKEGPESLLARALGADYKGKISVISYVAGIAFAYVAPWISALIYAAVSVMWLIPDRRIERALLQAARDLEQRTDS